MAAGFPAGNNTFIPSFDASGQLVIQYSRNPKDFAINKYTTITPVKKSIGYYLRITAEVAGRILNTDLKDRVWHDGNDAPSLTWGNESFEMQAFATTRYLSGFRLGYKSVDQADWKILASHAGMHAQAAMTARSQIAITALTTGGNYDSGHNNSATTWGGGKFDVGTVATPYLKNGLLAMAEQIHKSTLGAVQPKDMIIVLNPTSARKLSASAELMDAFKQQPGVWKWTVDGEEVRNGRWGLPESLYGFQVVVEDAVKVTSKKGATRAVSYAFPDDTLIMVSRPGGLMGFEGSASYSTGHFFMYEEMTVEQRDDPDNRRIQGRIVDDFDFKVVAPAAGAIASDIIT
jgi:hypothetical protein